MPLTGEKVVGGCVFLTLSFSETDGQWLGRCLELGATARGHSLKQAHAELVEVVELHLSTLEDAGEQEQFLTDNNIRVYPASRAPIEVGPQAPMGQELYLHARRFTL